MITAPKFWWRKRLTLPAAALAPAGWLYGWAAAKRMRRSPRVVAPLPVICVGNFVVGGAGKTPTAIAVALMLRAMGRKPGFLTRGYGGSARDPLEVDLALHDAARVGDEALLLAAVAPTVVSPDRGSGLPLLERAGVDVVILDDGFQSPALAKDLSLLVVDGGAGIGNGRVFPAGPLRAPLKPQFVRTDAVIVIGEGAPGDKVVRRAARAGKPVLRASLQPTRDGGWGEAPYLAFAGIGRPEKFFDSLVEAGVPLREAKPYPDHHAYTPTDARHLLARAEAGGFRLITTAKDAARLRRAEGELAQLRNQTAVFAVRLAFQEDERIGALLTEAIRRANRRLLAAG